MPLFNIGPSIDSLANDFVNGKIKFDPNYSGSIADLTALIATETSDCGNYVHQQNALHSTGNGRSTCSVKINALWAPVIERLQSDAAAQDALLQAPLTADHTQLYAGLFIVVLVLAAVVLLK